MDYAGNGDQLGDLAGIMRQRARLWGVGRRLLHRWEGISSWRVRCYRSNVLSKRFGLVLACAAAMWLFWALGTKAQSPGETASLAIDHPAIQYDTRPIDDRATRLARDLASGKVNIKPGPEGYLRSLLQALDVNPDSQALVFSKTSFQAARIDPRNPRALYFNDDVEVGFVRGSNLLEVAALDPKQGVIFYSVDIASNPPQFDRRDACLQCHLSPGTLGISGLLIASSYTDASGMPAFRGGQRITDHRTPLEDRWGGWYVTGTHEGMRHLGNAVGHDSAHPELLDMRDSQDLTSLAKKFDASGYLGGASDIVALMTLEHQTRMVNLMIRTGWEARIADPAGKVQLDQDIESLVTYMLFADEASLHGQVQGVSTFSKTFPERGPRDSQGRSLRDFDLRRRLFRYPLSYMIYSEAFDGMPENVRTQVYRRLYDVLTSRDTSDKFKRLSAEDRRAVLEILRDTKPGLPAYFRGETAGIER